jgi:hypothetical protein
MVGGFQIRRIRMPTNVRLTNEEQEAIRRKCIEINRLLVQKGMQPLRDSEVVHAILSQAIERTRLSASGRVVIDPE